jgi:hypothetical protein
MRGEWQKIFVEKLTATVGLPHTDAMEVMALVCEIRQDSYMEGYNRGWSAAFTEAYTNKDGTAKVRPVATDNVLTQIKDLLKDIPDETLRTMTMSDKKLLAQIGVLVCEDADAYKVCLSTQVKGEQTIDESIQILKAKEGKTLDEFRRWLWNHQPDITEVVYDFERPVKVFLRGPWIMCSDEDLHKNY